MEAVIYPDLEKVLVEKLTELLGAREEPVAQDVKVSTIKPSPDVTPYPGKTVVIRSDGGAELDHVRRLDRVGINIWAPTYAEASDLARLVTALLADTTGEAIKNVRITLHPIRVAEAGPEEHRYLTAEFVVKATNLTP